MTREIDSTNGEGGVIQAAPNLERRSLGALLAMLGGGAALAGCVGEADAVVSGRVAQAATTSSVLWFDSIATLRSYSVMANDSFALLLGYDTRGDGGGGVFAWKAGAPPTGVLDDDGIVIVSSGTTTGYWVRIYSGPINARWFGARGDGSHDDTVAIQKTINSVGAGNYTTAGGLGSKGYSGVYLPRGCYKVTSTLSIAFKGVDIVGDGKCATEVLFVPANTSGTQTLFDFKMPSGVLYQCALRDLWITSSDTSTNKVAVQLYDTSRFKMDSVAIFGWTGDGSVGIHTLGRELGRIRNIDISADRPIWIDINPNAPYTTEDLDCFHFEDLTITTLDPSREAIFVQPGVAVNNWVIDGSNDFTGGRYILKWDAPSDTSSPFSSMVTLRNFKCEGMTAAANIGGAAIHIALTQGKLRQLLVQNVMFSIAQGDVQGHRNRGLYLRNVSLVSIEDCRFPSIDTAAVPDLPVIDVDSTCFEVKWSNCLFLQYGKVSTGSLSCIQQSPVLAYYPGEWPPPSAHYSVDLQGLGIVWRVRDTLSARLTGSIAAGSTITVPQVVYQDGRVGVVTVTAYNTSSNALCAGVVAFVHQSSSRLLVE
ncbi:MAG: glycosyl hydrolase family 28-related protein [Polyangiales bacterium]